MESRESRKFMWEIYLWVSCISCKKNSNRGNVSPIHMSILVIILTDIAMHIREYEETEALYSSSTQSDTQLQRKTVFCQCSLSINKTFFEHSIYGAFLKLSLSHTGSKKCEIVDLKVIFSECRESEDNHENQFFFYIIKTYLWLNLFKEK